MSKCPVCGVIFAPAPYHVYKIWSKKEGRSLVCSWRCQRAFEKEREEQKKRKKEEQKPVWSYCEKCGREIVAGEMCIEIGDDVYCLDCCKKVDTRKAV